MGRVGWGWWVGCGDRPPVGRRGGGLEVTLANEGELEAIWGGC